MSGHTPFSEALRYDMAALTKRVKVAEARVAELEAEALVARNGPKHVSAQERGFVDITAEVDALLDAEIDVERFPYSGGEV